MDGTTLKQGGSHPLCSVRGTAPSDIIVNISTAMYREGAHPELHIFGWLRPFAKSAGRGRKALKFFSLWKAPSAVNGWSHPSTRTRSILTACHYYTMTHYHSDSVSITACIKMRIVQKCVHVHISMKHYKTLIIVLARISISRYCDTQQCAFTNIAFKRVYLRCNAFLCFARVFAHVKRKMR